MYEGGDVSTNCSTQSLRDLLIMFEGSFTSSSCPMRLSLWAYENIMKTTASAIISVYQLHAGKNQNVTTLYTSWPEISDKMVDE